MPVPDCQTMVVLTYTNAAEKVVKNLSSKDCVLSQSTSASNDQAYFAHELGHTVARQQNQSIVPQARQSPRVRITMYAASILSPITICCTSGQRGPGRVNWTECCCCISIILDEINATRHGLGIMKEAVTCNCWPKGSTSWCTVELLGYLRWLVLLVTVLAISSRIKIL